MIGHDLLEKYGLTREAAAEYFGPLARQRVPCREREIVPEGGTCSHGIECCSRDAPWNDWRAVPTGELYERLRAKGWDVPVTLDPFDLVRVLNTRTLPRAEVAHGA